MRLILGELPDGLFNHLDGRVARHRFACVLHNTRETGLGRGTNFCSFWSR